MRNEAPGPEELIRTTTERARPLERAYRLAEWEAAVRGTPEALGREQAAQEAYMRFWADPERYETARRLHESASIREPELERQLRLIYLTAGRYQLDAALLSRIAAVEARVRGKYYNFRARVDGAERSDNELDEILATNRSTDQVRRAWEASKQVGTQVAEDIRELARLRNRGARDQGFRDHFQRSLTLDEVDETELFELFERLEASTRPLFAALKARIDGLRSQHFGASVEELAPWHYGDRFFQRAPSLEPIDLEASFAGRDPVELAKATYDGLGLEVRGILGPSDLYPRSGKNQHAFCTHIDRNGDIRTLNNLVPGRRWTETLLHELGHGVYERYLDPALPWLLREPSHSLTTEAVALLMGSLTADATWLRDILGVPPAAAEEAAGVARRREQAQRLVFTRWCLVMVHFERRLYADPDGDLDAAWWELVERYQLLRRPKGRSAPDWAAKIHVALVPVYYQNYQLGHLVAEQLRHYLARAAGGITGRPVAGSWLCERVFHPGAREGWRSHVRSATGEALDPGYFVASLEEERQR
jgi:peptidyl-dipeptidase A